MFRDVAMKILNERRSEKRRICERRVRGGDKILKEPPGKLFSMIRYWPPGHFLF